MARLNFPVVGMDVSATPADRIPRLVLTGRYAAGFTTGLLTKDLGLCVAAAAALGVPMPVAAEVYALWQGAVAELGNDADILAMVKHIERAAGIVIGSERDVAD